jgi:ribosome-binding factor A
MKHPHQLEEKIAHVTAAFLNEISNKTSLITITRAQLNERKTVCTLFFVVLPDTEEENALIFMKRSAGDLRHYLRSHGGMMRVPHIEMCIDIGDKHRRLMDTVSRQITPNT